VSHDGPWNRHGRGCRVMAAIGRIDRFAAPEKLVAYLGLDPSVRQSGDGRAHHGRITKRSSSRARHLLVEAAWQTVRRPCPMRAFYERVRARRDAHVAAVAVARKLAVQNWPMLKKRRGLRLRTAATHGPETAQSQTRGRSSRKARDAGQPL